VIVPVIWVVFCTCDFPNMKQSPKFYNVTTKGQKHIASKQLSYCPKFYNATTKGQKHVASKQPSYCSKFYYVTTKGQKHNSSQCSG
jgi:hypothetical protein